jgi:catalase
VTLETSPSVLYDAIVLSGGAAAAALAADGMAVEFLKDAYRHCKPILVVGAQNHPVLEKAGIPASPATGEPAPGLVLANDADGAALEAFVQSIAAHRAFERETDPPLV